MLPPAIRSAASMNKTTAQKFRRRVLLGLLLLIVGGFLLPETLVIPVRGASERDWNRDSFWYEPWGASGVHKGIDIFAPNGREVRAAVGGLRLFQGELGAGGNVVAVLGPKWRIHYYAHLNERASVAFFLRQGDVVGSVGTSGNARGKPPHLHYTILSVVPLPWRINGATQGWKKMFFLNPDELLRGAASH